MNIRQKLAIVLAGAALTATTLGSASAATNLLNNGDLKPTTAGWTVVGHGTFNTVTGIGGQLNATEATKLQTSTYAIQCVPMDNDLNYRFEGGVKIPVNQLRTGKGYFVVRMFTGNNCAGSVVENKVSQHFSTQDGTWRDVTLNMTRNNPAIARSISVSMVVIKNATSDGDRFAQPFSARFRNLELTASPKVLSECKRSADGCGDDDLPTLPPPAVYEPEEPELPMPAPPAGDAPTLQPLEPASPTEPTSGGAPAQSPGDSPSSPTGQPGQPSTAGGTGTPGLPSNNDDDAPATDDGDAPAKQPPLQTATPDTTVHSATPTPPPPATGGDSTSDPADSLDYGDDQSDPVGTPSIGPSNNDPVGLPMMAGGFLILLLAAGLGIILKRHFRR